MTKIINGRKKGLSYEREIANELKPIFPDVKRHLEFQIQDCKGYDLDNTELLGMNFKIQCKRYKQYAPISKIFEVKEEGIPVLITRGDRQESMVVMKLDDWKEVLGELSHQSWLYKREKEITFGLGEE